jgi:signal transduction histidine kinase
MSDSPQSFREVDQVRLALSQFPESTPLDTIFAFACAESSRVLHVARVGVWLFVEHNRALRCVNLFERNRGHSAGAMLRVDDYPSYFQSLNLRKSVPAEVAVEDPRTAELADRYMRPLGIGSMLDAGLFIGGNLVGVICHEHVGPPRKFTTEEWDFASSMADLVALRIQTAELREFKAAFRTQERQLLAGEKADALAQMAAGVAHDFSNLLTIITGHAELLRDTPGVSEAALRQLAPIEEAASRGRAMVRELIDFARPEKEGAPGVIDLTHALGEFLPMIKSALSHSHQLVYEAETARALVLINRTQFCRIAFNLAINARDAMPDGGVITMRLASVRPHSHDGQPRSFVMLEVADTGIGMDPATLAKIGEPYFTTKKTGTGLGVAIVRKNAERAGGRVKYESKPGNGTVARVFLPRVGSATGDTQEYPMLTGEHETPG